jgi:hypothetical protein
MAQEAHVKVLSTTYYYVRIMKSCRMVGRDIGQMRDAYKILVGSLEGKGSLGGLRCRLQERRILQWILKK